MDEVDGTCMICYKKLSNKYILKRHLFKMHQISPEEDEKQEATELQFESVSDFYQWKARLEEDTCSSYIKARHVNNKNEEYHYFECSRSGQFKPRGEGRRSIKWQKTSKIGRRCPSRITLKVSESKCFVKFYKVHEGHEAQIEHLRLPPSFRAAVADRLKEGASVKEVVDNVRSRSVEKGIYSRAAMLKSKDLYNIKRTLNWLQSNEQMNSEMVDDVEEPESENVDSEKQREIVDVDIKPEYVDVSDYLELSLS